MNINKNGIEKLSKTKYYLLGILTGAFLVLSFPPFPLEPLAFIGLLPLFIAIETRQLRKPFLLLYLTFFIYHGGTNWWISSWQTDTDPYLLASGLAVWLVHPFFFFVPFFIYIKLRKKFSRDFALWFFPFIWVAYEWLHSLGELAYPWLTLGYTQIYNHYWVQAADICGVWGLSFLIVLINILFIKLYFLIKENKSAQVKIADYLKLPNFKLNLLGIILIIILPIIYGLKRTSDFDHNTLMKKNPTIKAAVIQPNINPWRKWETGVIPQIQLYMYIQDSIIRSDGKPDIAVWAETAIPYLNLDFNSKHNFSFIQQWLDLNKVSLLTGFADIYFYPSKEAAPTTAKVFTDDSVRYYDSYNTAMILNPTPWNKNLEFYHKMRLTPFGERIPYSEIFTFARKWLEWGVGISSWSIGREQKVLKFRNGSDSAYFGTIICIESIFPGFCSNFVAKGANVLSVITNDAWYDYTYGPEQHYLIAAMRAIECRRYLIRCGNSGVSGFISPTGITLSRAPQYTSVGISDKVAVLKNKSFYVIAGDWLVYCCTLITVISLIFAFFTQKKKKSSTNI